MGSESGMHKPGKNTCVIPAVETCKTLFEIILILNPHCVDGLHTNYYNVQ